jgi:hypothetical protein
MVAKFVPEVAAESREQRIEAIMQQLRPQIERTARQLVERAVEAPEEFHDAGPDLVKDIRQASVASRKTRGTYAAASPIRSAPTPPSFTRTNRCGS